MELSLHTEVSLKVFLLLSGHIATKVTMQSAYVSHMGKSTKRPGEAGERLPQGCAWEAARQVMPKETAVTFESETHMDSTPPIHTGTVGG